MEKQSNGGRRHEPRAGSAAVCRSARTQWTSEACRCRSNQSDRSVQWSGEMRPVFWSRRFQLQASRPRPGPRGLAAEKSSRIWARVSGDWRSPDGVRDGPLSPLHSHYAGGRPGGRSFGVVSRQGRMTRQTCLQECPSGIGKTEARRSVFSSVGASSEHFGQPRPVSPTHLRRPQSRRHQAV
jgi:hypothetical protein